MVKVARIGRIDQKTLDKQSEEPSPTKLARINLKATQTRLSKRPTGRGVPSLPKTPWDKEDGK